MSVGAAQARAWHRSRNYPVPDQRRFKVSIGDHIKSSKRSGQRDQGNIIDVALSRGLHKNEDIGAQGIARQSDISVESDETPTRPVGPIAGPGVVPGRIDQLERRALAVGPGRPRSAGFVTDSVDDQIIKGGGAWLD